MKFRVTFRNPTPGPDADLEWGAADRVDVWERYVAHNEYITIEFDSQTQIARVVPARKKR